MEKEREVSLLEIFRLFISKLWIILLVAIVVAASTGALQNYRYTPKYESTSSILVAGTDAEKHQSSSTEIRNWLAIAMTIVEECREVFTSRRVLQPVIEELALDRYNIDYRTLKGMISVSTVENTRIIYVTVRARSAELAADVVNAVCRHGGRVITEMDMGRAEVLDPGSVNKSPVNSKGYYVAALAGVVAAALVYAFFFVITFVKKKIITADDIKTYTGLAVLGSVSMSHDKKTRSKYAFISKK